MSVYLFCIPGEVSSLARKNLMICGISNVVFRVKNSGGVFILRVSGSARIFPAVQTICQFGNFLKIS